MDARWWDDESIWLADALVAYVAEALLRSAPGAQWGICQDDETPHLGQPVLQGVSRVDVHPWTHLADTVGRVWTGTDSDDDLVRLYSQYAPRDAAG